MKNLNEYLNEDFFGNVGSTPEDNKRRKIEAWLREYNIKDYTINKDLTIDRNSTLYLKNYPEESLPDFIQFNKCPYMVIGDSPKLNSLRGFPKISNLICIENCPNLKDLTHDIDRCEEMQIERCSGITSFKGLEKIKNLKILSCIDCENLNSLEGVPNKLHILHVEECSNLKSVEKLNPKFTGILKIYNSGLIDLKGCPKVLSDLRISNNDELISLEGCPDNIDTIEAKECLKLTSLEGIKNVTLVADFTWCKNLESLGSSVVRINKLYINNTKLSRKTDSEIDPTEKVSRIFR